LSPFSAESWLFLDASCCIWAVSFSFIFSFTSGIVYYPCETYFPIFRSLVKISCSLSCHKFSVPFLAVDKQSFLPI
jgi:hypothetical protein